MIETVKTLEELNNKSDYTEGQQVFVNENNQVYQYNDGWKPIEVGTQLNMNLYELNQQMVAQLEPLDDFQLSAADQLINKFVKDTKNKYYMVLCNELKYYTVFVIDNSDEAEAKVYQELYECLSHLGDVKSVEATKDNKAIEIWVHITDENPHVFYLFGYDMGIVHCKD